MALLKVQERDIPNYTNSSIAQKQMFQFMEILLGGGGGEKPANQLHKANIFLPKIYEKKKLKIIG